MSLFTHEFRGRLKGLMIWTIATFLFLILSTAKGEAFIGDPSVNEMLEVMPKAMLALFGMNGLDVSTYEGYYGVVYVYLLIAYAFYGINAVISPFLNEQKFKTAEYLYVKPLSRKKVAMVKLMSSMLALVIYQVIVLLLVASYFSIIVDANITDYIITLHMHAFLISIFFAGIALILSSVLTKFKQSQMVAYLVLLATYLIMTIDQLVETSSNFMYLSPFIFFSATKLLDGNQELIMYLICIVPFIIGLPMFIMTFANKESVA